MYSLGGVSVLDFGLLIWLALLSFVIWKVHQLIIKVIPTIEGDKRKNLIEKFDEVTEDLARVLQREQLLNKNIKEFTLEGLEHMQKVGILRYNPYGDTGGDQSFSVALLDGKGNGVLLTSLHTRSGTRVYAKEIIEGKSKLQLAKEEKEVLTQALDKKI